MPVNANESAALLDLAKSFTSSFEQRDRLSAALREHLGVTPRDSFYVSDDGTDDVLGPVVIYRLDRDCCDTDCRGAVKSLPGAADEPFFRVTYARLGDGYTFGEPVKVRRKTAYEAVRDSDAGEGLDAGQDEAEVPEWLAGALARAASLTKGAGHRYIRRVPKSGGGYRYFYKVSGGGGLGHEDEMKVGAKFRVANGGKEGHFEIVGKDDKGNLRIKHDESGHESSVSPAALRSMLHAEHAQSLTAHREKLAADIKATDDPKAKARLLAEAGKYEHTKDLAEPVAPAKSVTHDDIRAFRASLPDRVKPLFDAAHLDAMKSGKWREDATALDPVRGASHADIASSLTAEWLDKRTEGRPWNYYAHGNGPLRDAPDSVVQDVAKRDDTIGRIAESEANNRHIDVQGPTHRENERFAEEGRQRAQAELAARQAAQDKAETDRAATVAKNKADAEMRAAEDKAKRLTFDHATGDLKHFGVREVPHRPGTYQIVHKVDGGDVPVIYGHTPGGTKKAAIHVARIFEHEFNINGGKLRKETNDRLEAIIRRGEEKDFSARLGNDGLPKAAAKQPEPEKPATPGDHTKLYNWGSTYEHPTARATQTAARTMTVGDRDYQLVPQPRPGKTPGFVANASMPGRAGSLDAKGNMTAEAPHVFDTAAEAHAAVVKHEAAQGAAAKPQGGGPKSITLNRYGAKSDHEVKHSAGQYHVIEQPPEASTKGRLKHFPGHYSVVEAGPDGQADVRRRTSHLTADEARSLANDLNISHPGGFDSSGGDVGKMNNYVARQQKAATASAKNLPKPVIKESAAKSETRKSMSTVTDPERDLAKSLAASHRTAAEAQPDAGAKDAHEAAAQACDAAATADSTGDFRKALGAAERIGGLIKAWIGIPADQRRDFGAFAKSMQSPGGRLGDIRFAASNGTGDALGQMGRAFENARPPAEQIVQVAPEPTTYSPQRGAVNGMRKSMGSFYDRLSAGAAQQVVQGIRCPPEAKLVDGGR